jgi:hypothetical protein
LSIRCNQNAEGIEKTNSIVSLTTGISNLNKTNIEDIEAQLQNLKGDHDSKLFRIDAQFIKLQEKATNNESKI